MSETSETVHILRFQCDPVLEERLRRVSAEEERTMSQTIRHAVRLYLKERQP